jgi:hypothetical protein
MYGLTKEDYNKEFILNGKAYRVTGIKPNSRKTPILATRVSDNVVYKVSAEYVKFLSKPLDK